MPSRYRVELGLACERAGVADVPLGRSTRVKLQHIGRAFGRLGVRRRADQVEPRRESEVG
jgi:hypothetical protein